MHYDARRRELGAGAGFDFVAGRFIVGPEAQYRLTRLAKPDSGHAMTYALTLGYRFIDSEPHAAARPQIHIKKPLRKSGAASFDGTATRQRDAAREYARYWAWRMVSRSAFDPTTRLS